MFGNLDWEKLALLAVLALVIFGPERLPKIAADAGRLLRQLRQMATGATSQLRDELGPELADLDLTALHPKRFVARHLLADDDAPGMPAARVAAPLALGERPPFDSEAT